MIQIKTFVFNPFQENTYVLYDETGEGIIIDPGCYESFEKKQLTEWIDDKGIGITGVYNTHCHIDHVLGNDFCKDHFSVPLHIPEKEADIFRAVKSYAFNYGINAYREAEVDAYLHEDDEIRFGNTVLKVMFIPGHAPGHLVFYNEEQKICMAGDVLFQRSIGRTDLPGGDHETLIRSIREKLFLLDEETVVYPGHGPHTTIGEEKMYNPFVGLNV
jgi:glyoxylase-like metal-dependent hydrolase (beta-lactamase superfamily II)